MCTARSSAAGAGLALQPVTERRTGLQGPVGAVAPLEHQPRVQGVVRPRGRRVGAGRHRRAGRVEVLPHPLTRGLPAGVPPGVHGGVGERGDHCRADGVQQLPAAAGVVGVVADVEVDLERRGAGHHHRAHQGAVWTGGGEVGLHRVVARMAELAVRGAERVDGRRQEAEACGGERTAYVLRVLGEGLPAGGGAGEGRRAELELAPGLVRDRAAPRGRPYGVEQAAEPVYRHGVGGVVLGRDQPLQLGAHQSGWAGLEAHALDEPVHRRAVAQPLRGVAPQDSHDDEPNHNRRRF